MNTKREENDQPRGSQLGDAARSCDLPRDLPWGRKIETRRKNLPHGRKVRNGKEKLRSTEKVTRSNFTGNDKLRGKNRKIR